MKTTQYIKHLNIFSEISPEDLKSKKSFKICKDLDKGELVSQPGDCEGKVYIIERGQIRLYYLTVDGREQTLDILKPGNVFGDFTFENAQDTECSFASAETKGTSVCIVSKNDFFDSLTKKPTLAIKMIASLAERLSTAQAKVVQLSLADANIRLLAELVRLGKDFGEEDGNTIRLKRRFTHEQLASLIGTTRETVTKTIKAINDGCPGCIAQDKNHFFIINKDLVLDVIRSM